LNVTCPLLVMVSVVMGRNAERAWIRVRHYCLAYLKVQDVLRDYVLKVRARKPDV
jgi:hypothetical protein